MDAPPAGPRRIEINHRRMLLIALPMTLSHVTTPLLGLVDATVVGRLGEAHLLGAVALGAVIFDFLFWSFGSLRMATAGLTAQATGAGDAREVDRTFARALVVAGAVGLILVALQWPVAAAAFRLAGASEAVTGALSTYFAIRIWSAPFTLANYVILGSTLGRGRTDLGLLLQVAINVANSRALDRLRDGARARGRRAPRSAPCSPRSRARASGSRCCGTSARTRSPCPWREIRDRAAMLRTLAVNRDIMIRTVALVLAFAIFTAMGARSGDVTLAANAGALQHVPDRRLFPRRLRDRAETLCGQAVGARDERGFRRAVRLSLVWSLGFGLALSGVFLVAGGLFIDFVSTNPEVRAQARDFLVFAALTPLVGRRGLRL
jgi:MATE family multidrug resistance protein